MIPEIGPLPHLQPGVGPRPAARPAAAFDLELARAQASARPDTVELSLPPYPPAEVLSEVDVAAERADELRAANRELHFRKDKESGRVIVEVRDLDGNVIRTIPPSEALDVMAGASV